MIVINPSYKILTPISPGGQQELKAIELAARNCYKSESKISDGLASAKVLIANLIEHGHEAMLEHGNTISVRFICDRAVSHEIVRHRIASFAQESQRYCNYSKEGFGGHIVFVKSIGIPVGTVSYGVWKTAMETAEAKYFRLLDEGCSPQIARAVLPNSTKTDIIVTANMREWRHIMKLRTSQRAHPDMRYLMVGLLNELKEKIPVIFDDIE